MGQLIASIYAHALLYFYLSLSLSINTKQVMLCYAMLCCTVHCYISLYGVVHVKRAV